MADCCRIDGKIWDTLLYDTVKACLTNSRASRRPTRTMQRVDRLSGHDLRLLRRQDPRLDVQHDAFSVQMRETARRPILLSFFRWDDRLASLWIAEDIGCCASG